MLILCQFWNGCDLERMCLGIEQFNIGSFGSYLCNPHVWLPADASLHVRLDTNFYCMHAAVSRPGSVLILG